MGHWTHMGHGAKTMIDEKTELPETIAFGKYAGWPISALKEDPKYIRWLLDNQWIRLGVALAREPWIEEFIKGE